jgi:hypothetical protein
MLTPFGLSMTEGDVLKKERKNRRDAKHISIALVLPSAIRNCDQKQLHGCGSGKTCTVFCLNAFPSTPPLHDLSVYVIMAPSVRILSAKTSAACHAQSATFFPAMVIEARTYTPSAQCSSSNVFIPSKVTRFGVSMHKTSDQLRSTCQKMVVREGEAQHENHRLGFPLRLATVQPSCETKKEIAE